MIKLITAKSRSEFSRLIDAVSAEVALVDIDAWRRFDALELQEKESAAEPTWGEQGDVSLHRRLTSSNGTGSGRNDYNAQIAKVSDMELTWHV